MKILFKSVQFITKKEIVAIIIFLVIYIYNISFSDILFFIGTAFSTLFNGLVPILIAVCAYFLKQWLAFKKAYRESLLKCQWSIQQNINLVPYIEQNNSKLNKEKLIDNLELIPPFLECYSKFIDDNLRNQLITYNIQIIRLKSFSVDNLKIPNELKIIQKATFEQLQGQINLVDKVFSNPLAFYTLTHVVSFVVNKFFKKHL